jgi:hypothetical protein
MTEDLVNAILHFRTATKFSEKRYRRFAESMESNAMIELLDNKKICFNTECDKQSVSSCTSSVKDQDERVRQLEELLLEKDSKNQQTEEHIRNMQIQDQL